jgi:hypothetical protein
MNTKQECADVIDKIDIAFFGSWRGEVDVFAHVSWGDIHSK